MTAVHLATELSSPNVRVAAFIGCTIITHPLGIELQKQKDEIRDERRGMVGASERSERIRTYNFPQNRVIDHRIGLTLHKLDRVVDGDLDELVGAVIAWHQAARASRATNPSSERASREQDQQRAAQRARQRQPRSPALRARARAQHVRASWIQNTQASTCRRGQRVPWVGALQLDQRCALARCIAADAVDLGENRLCPEACATIGADLSSTVDIEFGCPTLGIQR